MFYCLTNDIIFYGSLYMLFEDVLYGLCTMFVFFLFDFVTNFFGSCFACIDYRIWGCDRHIQLVIVLTCILIEYYLTFRAYN